MNIFIIMNQIENDCDGMGTFVNSQGDKYTGTFKNNLKHGRGIEHYANGDVYNGEFVQGKPEGDGIYMWANGNEYRGQFRGGMRNGKGKWIKYLNKAIQKMDKICFSYDGEYVNDKK